VAFRVAELLQQFLDSVYQTLAAYKPVESKFTQQQTQFNDKANKTTSAFSIK